MAERTNRVLHALAQGLLQPARHLVLRQRGSSRHRAVYGCDRRFQLVEEPGAGGDCQGAMAAPDTIKASVLFMMNNLVGWLVEMVVLSIGVKTARMQTREKI